MKLRALAVCATALLMPFVAASCGADSTGDLKKSDVSKELVKQGLDKKTADCVADAMIKADFTKSELDKLNGTDNKGVDPKKVKAYTDAVTTCVVPAS